MFQRIEIGYIVPHLIFHHTQSLREANLRRDHAYTLDGEDIMVPLLAKFHNLIELVVSDALSTHGTGSNIPNSQGLITIP